VEWRKTSMTNTIKLFRAAKKIAPKAHKFAVKAAPIVGEMAKKNAPKIKEALVKAGPVVWHYAQINGPQIMDRAKKAVRKPEEHTSKKIMRRERKFKYSMKTLTQLYQTNKLSSEMYNYLSEEIRVHNDVLKNDPKNFERFFQMLIKNKDAKILDEKTKKYELARDNWIKNINAQKK
jgi:hypothetical protein